MVHPEPCEELRRWPNYLWLGVSLNQIHLPGLRLWLIREAYCSDKCHPASRIARPRGRIARYTLPIFNICAFRDVIMSWYFSCRLGGCNPCLTPRLFDQSPLLGLVIQVCLPWTMIWGAACKQLLQSCQPLAQLLDILCFWVFSAFPARSTFSQPDSLNWLYPSPKAILPRLCKRERQICSCFVSFSSICLAPEMGNCFLQLPGHSCALFYFPVSWACWEIGKLYRPKNQQRQSIK